MSTPVSVLSQLYPFLQSHRARAYLVGGSVRDALLGRVRYDIDLSVTGDAIALARAFADFAHGAFYVMDEEFGVARTIVESGEQRYAIDFALLRGDSIEQDLATRDFTMNAMAADISQGPWSEKEVVDPFGGREDLDAHRIRVVSSQVFDNDPVRLLRAVRFEASLGFALDAAAVALVKREARKLVDASPERVRDEFYKIIAAENCTRHIRRLEELELLTYFLPEVAALKGVHQPSPHRYDVYEHALHTLEALESIQRGDFLDLAEGAFSQHLMVHFAETVSADRRRGVLLRIATLLHDVGKPLAPADGQWKIPFEGHENLGVDLADRALRRLRFSNDEIRLLTGIISGHMFPSELAAASRLSDRDVFRYFRATGDVGVDIAVHAWCDLRARSEQAQSFETDAALQVVIARLLDRYYHARNRVVDPPLFLNGSEIITLLEVPQGPVIGKVLDALREAEAVGQVRSRDQAIEFVKNWQPDASRNSATE